jgi:hypothetical protein
MVGVNYKMSPQEIAQELIDAAVVLWGQERADAIRSTLEQTAENLSTIAQNLPDREEEPAFFL